MQMNESEVKDFVVNLIDTYESVIEYHTSLGNEEEAQCLFDEFREWFFASQGHIPFNVMTLPRLKPLAENNEKI